MSLTLFSTALNVGSGSVDHPAEALPSGVAFGAYAQPINGQTNIEAVQRLEDALGQRLPMVRAFGDWDDAFGADKPFHRWVRDGGRQLMVSVKPKRDSGQRIEWSAVASAQPGSVLYQDMARLADGARRFGQPMIVSFHHEPEAGPNQSYGDNEDFKAAFRRFVEVFRAEGATNVHFAWVMTSWSFEVGDILPGDRRRAEVWYPGDDVVDFIASDPYNWNHCRGSNEPWTSLERTIDPFMRFARRHPDKPLIIAEWGSDEGSPGQKAQWIDDARSLFKSGEHRDRIAAVLYFHDDGREEGWPNCGWWLDSSPQTLEAARRLAGDPFFRSPVPLGTAPPPPPPTTTIPATTTTPTAPSPPRQAPPVATDRPTRTCFGQTATIVGTEGPDRLRGTSGSDVMVGLGGNDVIIGAGGNDLICAGPGRDLVRGQGGRDRISGGDHRDRLIGGSGSDVIWGGRGSDILAGSAGRDQLMGGAGPDVIAGGRQRDDMYGHAGRDRLDGNTGDDHIEGGAGDDTLVGGNGWDVCRGGAGRDVLAGSCERATR